MSTRSAPISDRVPQSQMPEWEAVNHQPQTSQETALRIGFWSTGILFAVAQAWIFRYQVTADSISYLDMSDGVLPGADWHRLINGVWSPLYPLSVRPVPQSFQDLTCQRNRGRASVKYCVLLFAFICFEFFLLIAVKKFTTSDEASPSAGGLVRLPTWVILSLGYALFLWASISEISLRDLRADMLMSGFVYLRAEQNYFPRPYSGNLVVFHGSEYENDPTLGWGGLAEYLEHRTIGEGGQDSRRDLMDEPLVNQTASELTLCLAAASGLGRAPARTAERPSLAKSA